MSISKLLVRPRTRLVAVMAVPFELMSQVTSMYLGVRYHSARTFLREVRVGW